LTTCSPLAAGRFSEYPEKRWPHNTSPIRVFVPIRGWNRQIVSTLRGVRFHLTVAGDGWYNEGST
ncbi:hypothetical protein M514_02459, partial [Trichuris suis]